MGNNSSQIRLPGPCATLLVISLHRLAKDRELLIVCTRNEKGCQGYQLMITNKRRGRIGKKNRNDRFTLPIGF